MLPKTIHKQSFFRHIYQETCRFEARRADGDRRIARKAEAFLGHEDRDIHLVVIVLVMDDRDRIGAGRGCMDREIAGIGSFHRHAHRCLVLAAVRKRLGIGGQADEDLPLRAA